MTNTMITFSELKRNLKKAKDGLTKIRVAILGDTATQFLTIALRGIGIERGIDLDIFEAEYNQVERQFMDSSSELYSFCPDYVIVFQSTHKLMIRYNESEIDFRNKLADERLQFVQMMCDSLRCRLIYFNYPEIEDTVFGSYANKITSSFTYQVRKLNYELMNLSQRNSNLFLCDIAGLQNKIGRDVLFSSSIYANTEMVFSLDALPYVAARTMDIISVLQGKMKKCLILDLDNTLWGGVIGDDGLENIQLGHGLGIGKTFLEFQSWIKQLKQRGIILAVCSKNDESVAKAPFEKHPEMLLHLEDIAIFIANWENKADNIRQIQQILNIGFDSMVFLDDNPFERNLVRENIPDITVPELPLDPAEYLEYLYSLNLFETVSYSVLDSERTQQYQTEAQRVISRQRFVDEAGFLKSLNMLSEVTGFTQFNNPRVAQLSQRSNQFNLRTIRYTEADIKRLENDDNYHGLCFTLEDKFGDNGLICVVILKRLDSDSLFVENWFMSCRVLKRGMEDFTLNTIVEYGRKLGFKNLLGEFIPTLKNTMVAGHYSGLGFTHVGENLYRMEIDTYRPRECNIKKK